MVFILDREKKKKVCIIEWELGGRDVTRLEDVDSELIV